MSNSSIVTNRDRDCFACRLISGSGLIGAAIYISYHSKKFSKTPGKVMMNSIASVFAFLGTARIFDLPPFRHELPED